ncbi:unnamed protein product, partial [Polarella glacialis]
QRCELGVSSLNARLELIGSRPAISDDFHVVNEQELEARFARFERDVSELHVQLGVALSSRPGAGGSTAEQETAARLQRCERDVSELHVQLEAATNGQLAIVQSLEHQLQELGLSQAQLCVREETAARSQRCERDVSELHVQLEAATNGQLASVHNLEQQLQELGLSQAQLSVREEQLSDCMHGFVQNVAELRAELGAQAAQHVVPGPSSQQDEMAVGLQTCERSLQSCEQDVVEQHDQLRAAVALTESTTEALSRALCSVALECRQGLPGEVEGFYEELLHRFAGRRSKSPLPSELLRLPSEERLLRERPGNQTANPRSSSAGRAQQREERRAMARAAALEAERRCSALLDRSEAAPRS